MSAFMGYGGGQLADQVANETDELRKKRMAQMAGRPLSAGLGFGLSDIGGAVSQAFGGKLGGF
jgi:hypothetical protein